MFTLISQLPRTIVPRFSCQIQKRLFNSQRQFSIQRNAIFGIAKHQQKNGFLLSKRYFAVQTIKVPNMGDSISEGTLVEWTKKTGDYCNVDEVIAIIETDKVTIDIRTDHAGVLVEQLAKIDDTLEVGAPLFKIDTDAKGSSTSPKTSSTSSKESTPQQKTQEPQPKTQEPPPKRTEAVSQAPPPPPPKETSQSKTPSPSPSTSQKPSSPSASSSAPVNSSSSSNNRAETRVAMSRMRLRIAERLKEAQNTAACLTTFNEIDMSNIMNVRNKYKDVFLEKHGVKLGFMSAFVSAAVSALKAQPAVNAYIEGKEIVYHDYCDVSVAVASPTGLVVPVVRNADQMSFAEIEKQIQQYAEKAKKGALTIPEMTGGTFTISNGGVFGSLMGTPILNPPQSAILGMHGVFERPVAINNQVQIRPMMYVALTYDHRIIDGREAVLFLRRIKDCIEDPSRILLDV